MSDRAEKGLIYLMAGTEENTEEKIKKVLTSGKKTGNILVVSGEELLK